MKRAQTESWTMELRDWVVKVLEYMNGAGMKSDLVPDAEPHSRATLVLSVMSIPLKECTCPDWMDHRAPLAYQEYQEPRIQQKERFTLLRFAWEASSA